MQKKAFSKFSIFFELLISNWKLKNKRKLIFDLIVCNAHVLLLKLSVYGKFCDENR
jgi:hypothetical protein